MSKQKDDPKDEPFDRHTPSDSAGENAAEAVKEKEADKPEQKEEPAKEDTPEKTEAPRKKRLLFRLLRGGIILAVSIVLAVFLISLFTDRYGLGRPDKNINVTIPDGATSSVIAGVLQKNGVIVHPMSFRLFVRQNKVSGFQSGIYTVNPTMGYDGIVSVLTDPAKNKNNVKFTITEGTTLSEIASGLQADGVCSKQDCLSALNKGGFDFPLGSQIPNSTGRYTRYEGYLFPDTYTLHKHSSAKAVAQKMFSNFSSKFTSAMVTKAKQKGLTVDQTVTLASVIQKEASEESVMADVASVFYNRLNTGVNGKKLLQSDATVLYAKETVGDTSGTLHSSDLSLDSRYNTYRYEGLPPGPICNPGIEAIDAALDPSNTSYFYFVSDVSGKYYFAKTYAEHLANVKTAGNAGNTKAAGDLSSGT